MKGIKAKMIIKLATVFMLLEAVVQVVAAEAIGDGYTIGGYNAGWVLIILGIIGIGLAVLTKLPKKATATISVVIMLIGGALIFVAVPATTVEDKTGDCPEFEFTGTAVTTGTNYIRTTAWDEDTNTLTVPLTVNDSSEGHMTAHITGLNLTLDPIAGGFQTLDITSVKVSSDYTMKYGGEDVLDKTGNSYDAVITSTAGDEFYKDSLDIPADETDWALITWTFNNNTAGNWLSEITQVGDSITWYVTLENQCGQRETITVIAMCVSYTA